MAYISLGKVQNVLPEFVNTRLLSAAPADMKWLLGGATAVIMLSANKMIAKAMPTLEFLDLVNEHQQLDIEKAKVFLDHAFAASPSVRMLNFTFTRDDGDYLLGLLDRYKDG